MSYYSSMPTPDQQASNINPEDLRPDSKSLLKVAVSMACLLTLCGSCTYLAIPFLASSEASTTAILTHTLVPALILYAMWHKPKYS